MDPQTPPSDSVLVNARDFRMAVLLVNTAADALRDVDSQAAREWMKNFESLDDA